MSCSVCKFAPGGGVDHPTRAAHHVAQCARAWRDDGLDDAWSAGQLLAAADHYDEVRGLAVRTENARARLRLVETPVPPAPATEPSPDTRRAVAEACGDDDFKW